MKLLEHISFTVDKVLIPGVPEKKLFGYTIRKKREDQFINGKSYINPIRARLDYLGELERKIKKKVVDVDGFRLFGVFFIDYDKNDPLNVTLHIDAYETIKEST